MTQLLNLWNLFTFYKVYGLLLLGNYGLYSFGSAEITYFLVLVMFFFPFRFILRTFEVNSFLNMFFTYNINLYRYFKLLLVIEQKPFIISKIKQNNIKSINLTKNICKT